MKSRLLVLLALLGTLIPAGSAATTAICDQGGFDQSTCNVTSSYDITNQSISDSGTDIIVKSGGRLYTEHVSQDSINDASIVLEDGSFIVKSGGAIHANLNISAYNIKVEEGGVIDASGLGWQAAEQRSSSCTFGTSASGHCLGGGPAGGASGSGNSNTGSGGGGHGGKGGSYKNGNFYGHGGGYGPTNSETYGSKEKPTTFGSGGGAHKTQDYLTGVDGKAGHSTASSYSGARKQKILNATDGNGDRDDPDSDPLDSDRWISTNVEYRKNNPYDILMGSGGGRLKLIANNKINITGNVIANGLDGGGSFGSSGYGPGGGAGGSIWISAGGLFGDGTIRADGGTYMEKIDSGQDAFGGGGGGGRVYYEYSIQNENWTISASDGEGSADLPDKGWGGNSNSNHVKNESATDGTVVSRIAFSANVNDTIINPEGPMKVNGTASSKVTITLNGTKIGETEPRASDGFYNLTVNGLDINDTQNLGNYSMVISSTISGNTISERFNISHRKIRIEQSSEYLLKKDENLLVDGTASLIKGKPDGSGVTEIPLSGETLESSIYNSGSRTDRIHPETNESGEFSFTSSIEESTGRKYYETRIENAEGITGFDRKNIGWIALNDTIVNPSEPIKINGTSYNPVNITLNDSQKAEINPSSEYFLEDSINALSITDLSRLGNYTLEVSTWINDKLETRSFDISIRAIDIEQSSSYLLKPGETFTVKGEADLIREDGQNGSTRSNYSNSLINTSLYSAGDKIGFKSNETNQRGEFNFTGSIPETKGRKYYTTQTENSAGIRGKDSKNLAWLRINDHFINDGEYFSVNGTAYSNITFRLNNSKIGELTPGENFYYRFRHKAPETEGNYTLKVSTSLNNASKSRKFEIAVQGIEFNLESSYPRSVEPRQNFSITGNAYQVTSRRNGEKTSAYANEKIKITYIGPDGILHKETVKTDPNGAFQTTDSFKSPINAGNREIRLQTENSRGITGELSEVISTRILLENGSSRSPEVRKFKDSLLDQTSFINPEQNVTFRATTRRSLNFVKNVSAIIETPSGDTKTVLLQAQNVLGSRLATSRDWDTLDTQSNIQHLEAAGGNKSADEVQIGPKISQRLALYLPLDSQDPKAVDISGRGNNATNNGAMTRAEGVFSSDAYLFGGDDYLELGSSSSLEMQNSFTISAWIKTSANSRQTIYARSDPSSENAEPLFAITSSGEPLYRIGNSEAGATSTVTGETSVNDGNWHHLTGVFDDQDNEIRIYVDGKLDARTTTEVNTTSFDQTPLIGAEQTLQGRQNYFSGTIDEIMAYNKSLEESRIRRLSSRNGTAMTSEIEISQPVSSELKILKPEIDLRNQSINITVLSDHDGDGDYTQTSRPISLERDRDIYSVKGLENRSSSFRLKFELSTQDVTKTPELDSLELRARKGEKLLWKAEKPVSYLGGELGNYSVTYRSTDFAGNSEDLTPEKSSFAVRNISIEVNHSRNVESGDILNITGNATVYTGDGSGNPVKKPYNGSLNVIYNDTIRGTNRIPESRHYSNITDQVHEIYVDGEEPPEETEVTFIGKFSGVEEYVSWSGSTDWDSYRSRLGLVHQDINESIRSSKTVSLGYRRTGTGLNLDKYYSMDDQKPLVEENTGGKDLESSEVDLSKPGIASSTAIYFENGSALVGEEQLINGGSNSFTVNLWIKPSEIPSDSNDIQNSGNPSTLLASPEVFNLQLVRNNEVFVHLNTTQGSYDIETDSDAVQTDTWQMLTVRYTGSELGLYRNGNLIASNSSATGSVKSINTKTLIGYRNDSAENAYNGSIDELRVYSSGLSSSDISNLNIYPQLGRTVTGIKSFSEDVRPESLILRNLRVEENGQDATLEIRSDIDGDGSFEETSDTVELESGVRRYNISGLESRTSRVAAFIELQGNITHSPILKSFNISRRQSTRNPGVDIDGDDVEEANFTGKIFRGEKVTRKLEGLETGYNTLNFSVSNATFDARINYTEILVNNSKESVDVTNGAFSTQLVVPEGAKKRSISYYTTTSKGIFGQKKTFTVTGLDFDTASLRDSRTDDRISGLGSSIEVNASLNQHLNPIESVWIEVNSPEGVKRFNLSDSGDSYSKAIPIRNITLTPGNYTVSFKARDSNNITEAVSPQVSLKIRNGSVSAVKSKETVGLNRTFTINGTVKQQPTGRTVNATVNASIPYSGYSNTTSTDSDGFYSIKLRSPTDTGNFTVDITSQDLNGVKAYNRTTIEVKDSTSASIEVPSSIAATQVDLDSGQNKTYRLNITNNGDIDIQNLILYHKNLPTVENDKLLESEGASDWESINHTYNIDAGETKTVEGEIWIKEASTTGTYSTITTAYRFNTSGGETIVGRKNISQIVIEANQKPLWQRNNTVTVSEGFEGNLLPPGSKKNNTLVNEGSGQATDVSWTITSERFRAWTESFVPDQDPDSRQVGSPNLDSGSSLGLLQYNVDIPDGTPPGNYTTELESSSADADETNSAEVTVNIPNKPTYNLTITRLKDDVKIPEEVNQSNPIDVGQLPTGQTGRMFRLDIDNTGNRDLEYVLTSSIATGDDKGRFLFNTSDQGTSEEGRETLTSDITLENSENYTYRVPDANQTVYYSIASDATGEDYRANLTIECSYPIGGTNNCNTSEIVLPMKGTVEDPEPYFENHTTKPSTVGLGKEVRIGVNVLDNDQSYIYNEEPVNFTLIKGLNGSRTEETLDPNLQSLPSRFIYDYTANENLSTGPDWYGIRVTAKDSTGQESVSKQFNFSVRKKAERNLNSDQASLQFDDITAETGDSTYISGNITGGEVYADDVNLSITTNSPSNFDVKNRFQQIGTLEPGETFNFNTSVTAAAGTSPFDSYTLYLELEWRNPDGTSRAPNEDVDNVEVPISISPTRKLRVSHGSNDKVTLEHNSSMMEPFTVKSYGNAQVTGIDFSCTNCDDKIHMSYNNSDIDLASGEKITVGSEITVEEFVEPTNTARNTRISSDYGTVYLNETLVEVKSEKAIRTEPDNLTAAVPANSGTITLSTLLTENIGNDELELRYTDNDTSGELFIQDKSTTYTTTISRGGNDTAEIKLDTDGLPTGAYSYQIIPELDSTGSLEHTDYTNITVYVQDLEYNLISIEPETGIEENDEISAEFELTQEDEPVTDSENVDIKLKTDGGSYDIPETYNASKDTWRTHFQAPRLEDGENHTFRFETTSSAFRSTLSNSTEISYLDVTAPEVLNSTAESVISNNESALRIKLSDKSDIVDVSAVIEQPGDDLTTRNLDKTGSNPAVFETSFNQTSSRGLYTANFTASDEKGNTREIRKYFRVYKPIQVSGDAGKPQNSTEVEFLNPDGSVEQRLEPSENGYNRTIKSGNYDVLIEANQTKSAIIEDIDASRIAEDPPEIDPKIEEYSISTEHQLISGFGVSSGNLENIDGKLWIDYSNKLDEIDYQGNLVILKCENYSISGESCNSELEKVTTAVDTSSNVADANISSFSSYMLVENETSSTEQPLNINISGELGNLSELENLDNLELLDQIANNTDDLSNLDGISNIGDIDGGGSSGGGSFRPPEEEENDSNPSSISIGNNRIDIQAKPGQTRRTALSIRNPFNRNITVSLTETDNLDEYLKFKQEVELRAGEFKSIRITAEVNQTVGLKEITGFINVEGDEVSRTVPVTLQITSAERRLLDASIEPTVRAFSPGEQASFKISLSNQGFARAVDAETEVRIIDPRTGETIARKQNTYAVQTTLDKIISVQIPEDEELGQYEVRANVEYANVPGNRSATTVSQIEVTKPFWERTTLGVKNSTIGLAILLLIITGSAGGYYYYRRKKLKEKRKRFEEQVDNDAIPSESGRTAFIGKLSEIGTRAFINLEDLKTHCLTAGATGAGKSVAAQVIVEEALEQGVNVIVLDPTGQWSGYLEKNENDEFFAFYDDFGMSESDARSYQGNIRAVDADQDTIDITDMLRPEGEEGSINVFSMHKLENAELEEYLSDTIQQIFDHNPEEKDRLETLVVYDEAHRVLEKFGGTGRGVKMLERGAREFRKWGIGMVMISQVIEDFPEEVRANIGTQIQLRTEYEGDLDRIERKYGNHISQGVTKANTGTGMLENSSYNHGRPYFVDFRPIKHSPERLSDEELEKFEKYNRRVDEIEDMIAILEDDGEDVFEYRSQLKLVKKNIRKRSFNLVETYLDELEEDLENELDL